MAQALFDQAKKLMADGNFVLACPKLEESQRLDPGIGTLLNLADCYEHEGKTATAWSKFLEAASAAKAAGQTERETIARERAAVLNSRLPALVIRVPAAANVTGLQVRRDGVLVGGPAWGTPIPVDQGLHTISVTAPGRKTWESKLMVKGGGGVSEVTVPALEAQLDARSPQGAPPTPTASAEAAPAEGRSHTLAWTLVGVGAAMALGGGALALVETSKANDAADARDRPTYDSAKSTVLVGDVLAGVGSAAAAAGVVLLLQSGGAPAPTAAWRAGPWLGATAGGVQLKGQW